MRIYSFLALALLLTPLISHAYSASSVVAILQGYNVSNTIIDNLTYANFTYNSSSYVLLSLHGQPYFLINASNFYTFVINQGSISSIISAYVFQQSYERLNTQLNDSFLYTYRPLPFNPAISIRVDNSSYLFVLWAEMYAYQQSSTYTLNACLDATGLNTLTCTAQNYCSACSAQESCNQLNELSSGAFGAEVENWSIEYNTLNDSFNNFYTNIGTSSQVAAFYNTTRHIVDYNASFNGESAGAFSQGNIQAQLAAISAIYANISVQSSSFITSPLFGSPLPSNVTTGELDDCSLYPPNAQPWYCDQTGFCANPTFNDTLLNQINGQFDYIDSLPLSSTQISRVAANVTTYEDVYILPGLSAVQRTKLEALLNTTLKSYQVTVNATSKLLLHVNNASLAASLLALENGYANATNNYLTTNFTRANKTLYYDLANVEAQYLRVNATYTSIISLAGNNTALLLEAQLDTKPTPAYINNLAFKQLQLDAIAGSNVTDTVGLLASLNTLNKQAKSAYANTSGAFSASSIARGIDAPLVTPLILLLHQPYASSVGLVPYFAILLPLIIGIVIFVLAFMAFSRMKKAKRIAQNRRVLRNWYVLFAIIWILIIFFVALDFLASSDANAFTPVSAFLSSYSSAHSVALIANGSQSVTSPCLAAISHELPKSTKVVSMSFSGTNCTIAGSNVIRTRSTCLNNLVANGTPAVELTQNTNASFIHAYSLYGSLLTASGSPGVLNECYAALILK